MLVWIASTPLEAAEQRAHAGKKKRPNIMLIMADDLGVETLGCYRNSIFAIPNLDRMASEGARYNNADATPICTPTRAMILTGLHPNRTGFLERLDSPADRDTHTNRLPTHLTTFVQLFKDDGYATAIAGKNPGHAQTKERLQEKLDEYMKIRKTDDSYTVIPFSAKRAVPNPKKKSSAGIKKKKSSAARSKPNVVIFFTDDQGTLDANCYGSDDLYTPTMDRLAATGVRFTQAYSHAVCCPARALLLTGRHPQRSGIVNWTQQGPRDPHDKKPNLPLSEITLAEALKDAGYATALFGKWHLGSEYGHGPINQGFDTFFGHLGGFIDNYNHHFLHGEGFHDLYEGDEEIFMRGDYFPDLTTKRAVEYIEANKDTPFFMYVAFNIPHYPEQPDVKFDERYKDMEMPRRSYAKMVSTVDDRMGAIMKKLEETGIRGNTIVLFLSDNGHSAENNSGIRVDNHTSGFPKGHYYSANGGGGNTGKWIGHKGQFYEGGVRVPAILSYPARLPKGVVRDQAVIGADWFPTILKLCDVKLPKVKLDGRSLLPLIKSPDDPSPHKVLHWGWAGKWAVREGPWKLSGQGEKALHLGNLDDEAPEVKDYLEENPERVKRLRDLHNQWAKDTAVSMD